MDLVQIIPSQSTSIARAALPLKDLYSFDSAPFIFFNSPILSLSSHPYNNLPLLSLSPNISYLCFLCSDQLRQRLVRMSVRHHEQILVHQQREASLLLSLQDCSNVLVHAVSLLNERYVHTCYGMLKYFFSPSGCTAHTALYLLNIMRLQYVCYDSD
jgi:hypothetical protein